MTAHRPDDPPRQPDDDEEELRPPDDEGAAIVRERGEGAHEEQISDEANLRADPTPPPTD